MDDKIYIFREVHDEEGRFVKLLADAFSEIMVEQIEAKAKQILIEAIHPKYRSREVDIKFAKAFDDFLKNPDYIFNIKTIEDVIKQRDEAKKIVEQLRCYWSNFTERYEQLQISGSGNALGVTQEMIRKISLILEE